MQDLKRQKNKRVKGNRRNKVSRKVDWKSVFHRCLRVTLFTGSAALVISGSVLVVQVLFESGYFGVEQVKVLNFKRLSAEEIIAESNINSGDNIFLLDLEAIGKKIEENPWVARAEVGRVFPREIVIRITERDARAIINLGYLYYVDKDAEIFKLLDVDDRLDYPIITGIRRNYLLEHPEKGRKLLQEAMMMVDRLAKRTTFSLDKISEVHVDDDNGVVVTTYRAGVPVQLGFGGHDEKLDRLERIYADLEPKLPILKGIDLNVSDRVIVKIDEKFTSGKG